MAKRVRLSGASPFLRDVKRRVPIRRRVPVFQARLGRHVPHFCAAVDTWLLAIGGEARHLQRARLFGCSGQLRRRFASNGYL